MGPKPSSGITTAFIKSLNTTPATNAMIRSTAPRRGRTKPRSPQRVPERAAQTRTSAAPKMLPLSTITMIATIPAGPNPLRLCGSILTAPLGGLVTGRAIAVFSLRALSARQYQSETRAFLEVAGDDDVAAHAAR